MMNNIHSIAYSSDDTTEISPRFKLRFERLPNPSGRGICFVDISLQNNGAIGANFPFLCITSLGLNITPAAGWAQRHIKIVRKMQRFAPIKNDTLEPQSEVACCTIMLRSKFNTEGYIEYERGSEHPIATLPDLNLLCVVGAGNYPSKRVVVPVPSTAIKTVIEQKDLRFTEPRLAQA
jgi:hypothetical protein